MAASRLLISGRKLHFHTKGPLRLTRSFFSSSSQNKEFVQRHAEVFPKPTEVQKEVKGSWYLLNSLKKLKDKVFSSPLTEKVLTSEPHDIIEDSPTKAGTSEVAQRGDKSCDELKSTLQSSENLTGNNFEKNTAVCPTSDSMTSERCGGSVRFSDYSNTAKIVESRNGYHQSEAEPEADVIRGRHQEAASTSWEVRKTDERLGAAELDDQKSRNKYQEEAIKELSHLVDGFVGEGVKITTTSDIAGSTKDASVECERLPPQKKFITHAGSNGRCELRDISLSGSAKKEVRLVDPLDNNNLTVKTSSGYSMETYVDDSFNVCDIKDLLGHVKKLPIRSTKTRSSDHFLHDDFLPKESQQIVTDETLKQPDAIEGKRALSGHFIHKKPKKQGEQKGQKKGSNERSMPEVVRNISLEQPEPFEGPLTKLFIDENFEKEARRKSQKKGPKERRIPDVTSQHMDNDLFLELESVTCDKTNSPNSDSGRTKKAPSARAVPETRKEYENVSKLEAAKFDYSKSMTSSQIPLPSQKEAPKKDSNPLLFTEKGGDETNLLVRFVLQSKGQKDIKKAFMDCGPIDEVHFINSRDDWIFKDAYVKFKTKDGMRKALAKTEATVGRSDVVVEAVSPLTYTTNKIRAPSQIEVPGIPPSLVQNPTRTVMVKGLAQNVSLRHLEAALSFCGACITGFFMGSSSSVAYIEFETENAKEKAIAACSIPISRNKLSILRIDSPSTTVVRISNAQSSSNIGGVCSKYGKIKRVNRRDNNLVDVHYNLDEWPVMVNILNSLNGQVVDGCQWIAQPAPIIPVEILKFLWSEAEGRRRVHSVFQTLLQKLGEDDALLEMRNLSAQYYEESIKLFQK